MAADVAHRFSGRGGVSASMGRDGDTCRHGVRSHFEQFIDYDLVENENIAEHEENAAVVAELSALLLAQFDKSTS